MDIYGAYLVGYFTAYSGIPFRAFEILGDVARSCSPEELEIIRAHLDFVKSRNSKTADMIVGVEALLAEGGLLQPLKPQTFIQWDIWARTARCAVAVATTRDSSVECAAGWRGYCELRKRARPGGPPANCRSGHRHECCGSDGRFSS